MLVGKMKAWLCAALAATASGFGSFSGDFVHNPCANPDKFTPEAMLPGSCEGADEDTQELCEGAGGVWSTSPCNAGHHAGMSTSGACDDVVDAQSGETYQQRFFWWGTACCSDQVPLCCADDDVKLASDSQGMVASCAAGLAEYGGCSQDMYTLGNAKMQELCAGNSNDACAEGAPPGWFMQTCPTSCGAC